MVGELVWRDHCRVPLVVTAAGANTWSIYTAVLCLFFPHVALRLFLYQHFIMLKSRSF